ncbi:MAG: hypothetical protein LBT20_08255 [Clostridiales bacterium]|jgi:hypothetical protein|nr:hypothetical protein [Clostridiales bacterium]
MASGKKVSRVGAILILVLSLLAVAVAIIPNYVKDLPVIDTYNYIGSVLDGKIFDAIKGFSDLNVGIWDILYKIGLGAPLVIAAGAGFAGITAIVALISVITKKKLGLTIFALLAFVLTLGYLVLVVAKVVDAAGKFDFDLILKNLEWVATGYWIQLGLTFVAFVTTLFIKKKAA